MKLIIVIMKDEDSDHVLHALIEADFRVTRIATTGGFLRRGSTTLMIGVEDERVDKAVAVIRESTTPAVEPGMKRATLFILNVADYIQV